jgi:hypothetical protein
MRTDRIPLYLSIAAATLFAAAVLTLQPYSADRGFAIPAERYVRAALAHDSMRLARLSVADSPVSWALDMARRHPTSLEAWARHSQAFVGERHGDTTQVFLYSRDAVCGDEPIQFQFVGLHNGARVAGADLRCDSTPDERRRRHP